MIDFLNNEVSLWDYLKSEKKPLLIYGTGDGADKVLDICIQKNIKIYGIFASDDFAREQLFRGYIVKKLCDFEKELDDFTVLVAFASNREAVIENIKKISKKYKTFVPNVPVYGNTIVDDIFLKEYEADIISVYGLMSDEKSKQLYEDAFRFYYSGKIEYLWNMPSPKKEAFDNILKISENEVFVDAGAYNGDTVLEFIDYTNNKYEKIYAFEPNPKTFKRLLKNLSPYKNISLFNVGSWNEKAVFNMNTKKGRGSCLNNQGVSVDFAPLDLYIKNATYLKMDVEGAEAESLIGAFKLIKSSKPKLCISVYHHFEDIFKIPILIKSINPEYKFYLRKEPCFPCWDLNLYAIC